MSFKEVLPPFFPLRVVSRKNGLGDGAAPDRRQRASDDPQGAEEEGKRPLR